MPKNPRFIISYTGTEVMAQLKPCLTRTKLLLFAGMKFWIKNETESNEEISLIVTSNRTLLDLRHIINRNWDFLQIESKLKEIFKNLPIATFKMNKNLCDFISGEKIRIIKS